MLALVSTGERVRLTQTLGRRRLSIYLHIKLRFPKKLNTQNMKLKRRVLGGQLATASPCESVAGKVEELVMAEKIYGN